MVEWLQQAQQFVIAQAAFDAQCALADGRQRDGIRHAVADAIVETQTLQAGAGQHDGVVVSGIQLGQPGVHVASQHLDFQVRAVGPELGFTAQARGANHGALGQLVQVVVVVADKGIGGIFALTDGDQPQALRELHGYVFHGVHGKVGAAVQHGFFQFLQNRPLPPILARGTSRILSPWVLILTSSTVTLSCSRSSSDLMNSACHSASALLRVAMRRVRLDMALTVVRENVPQGYLVAVKKSRGCPGIPRQGEGWCSCNHWRTWPVWRRLTGSSAGSPFSARLWWPSLSRCSPRIKRTPTSVLR